MIHICVSNLTITGSDNGLSPGQRQGIFWTNVGILLIGPFGIYFSEIIIKINTFSFKKMPLKLSSWKWQPFCLGLNVSTHICISNLTIRWWLVTWFAPSHYLNKGWNSNYQEHISVKSLSKFIHFLSRKCIVKCQPFCLSLDVLRLQVNIHIWFYTAKSELTFQLMFHSICEKKIWVLNLIINVN